MTEAEWLASGDPVAMLDFVTSQRTRAGEPCPPQPSDRKLRLYACACWRYLWPDSSGEANAVEECLEGERQRPDRCEHWINQLSTPEAATDAAYGMLPNDAHLGAALLREIVGNPFWAVMRVGRDWGEFVLHERHLLFYERWLTPTVLSLAQAPYDERQDDGTLDPFRLTLVADALEEAGCDTQLLLMHLRGRRPCVFCGGSPRSVPGGAGTPCMMPGPNNVNCRDVGGWHTDGTPHVRGCWALDLLLGKA